MCLVAKKGRKKGRKKKERGKEKKTKDSAFQISTECVPGIWGQASPPPSLEASSFSVWLPLVVARWLLTVSATTVFSLVKESHFQKSLNVFSEK